MERSGATTLAAALFALLASFLVARIVQGGGSVYGVLVVLLLGSKLLMSQRRTARRVAPPAGQGHAPLDLVAVVPFFNEDPELLAGCLRSLLAQSRRPRVIYVVDDGSTDPRAAEIVLQLAASAQADGVDVRPVSQTCNRGKREALAVAFRAEPDADAYVTVDSDTYLEPNAIAELVAELDDERVKAATGLVLALNGGRNLLTRMIDVRYVNAFLFDRAAHSAVGAVLCTCGSLSVYRAEVVHRYLDDFLDQRFLGTKAVFGDDRRLTNYALKEGRVVLARRAIAHTAVPERLSHYLRQQVRWNKSFFRESIWAIGNLPLRHPGFVLSSLELLSWIVFTTMMVLALLVAPWVTGGSVLVIYLGYVLLMALLRSVRYLDLPDSVVRTTGRWQGLAVSPLYGLLNLVVLLPLRAYSLATLRDGSWGTRRDVEVTAS
jgi:hyaluronan synthase